MAGIAGSQPRKRLAAVLVILGCMALLLFCSRVVSAEPLVASWYGPGFEGNLTANGEVFDPSGYTAAHKTYDFDTKLIVTYEGRSVVVRINDRGPFVEGRDLDLAQGAAEYIGLTGGVADIGVATVDVQVADPSTPVGPYALRDDNASAGSALQAEPVQAEPAQEAEPVQEAEPTTEPAASESAAADTLEENEQQDQEESARRPDNGDEDVSFRAAQAGGDQYASAEQYAAEDQYVSENQGQQVTEVAPEEIAPAPPAPKPEVPVLPPEPEPEALVSPPEELAVPNSTVQKRVELEIAAEPTPQPVEEEAEPAPEPEPAEETETVPEPEPVEEEAVPEPEPVEKEEATPELAEEPAKEKTPEPEAAPEQEPVEEEAAPEPEPVENEEAEPEPAKEKAVKLEAEPEAEKPSEELTVLPDTGGTLLSLPVAGGLLMALGISVRLFTRR